MISWLKSITDLFSAEPYDEWCGCDSCDCEDENPRVHCTIYLTDGDTIELSHSVTEPGTYKEFDRLSTWFVRSARMNNHDSVYVFEHDYGSILLRFSNIRRIEIEGAQKRS